MASSLTICQEVVAAILKPYLEKEINIYHYTDDILTQEDKENGIPQPKDLLVPALTKDRIKNSPEQDITHPHHHLLGNRNFLNLSLSS